MCYKSEGPGEERRQEQEGGWNETMSEDEGLDPSGFVQHSN